MLEKYRVFLERISTIFFLLTKYLFKIHNAMDVRFSHLYCTDIFSRKPTPMRAGGSRRRKGGGRDGHDDKMAAHGESRCVPRFCTSGIAHGLRHIPRACEGTPCVDHRGAQEKRPVQEALRRKRTNITVQQLSNYEKGRSKATVEKAAAICKALNVTYTIGA